MIGAMEQETPFPPILGVRVKALCPPGTGLGFLGILEKAAALAASVLNTVETVTPGFTGTYALMGVLTDPGDRRLSDCLLCLLARVDCFWSLQ